MTRSPKGSRSEERLQLAYQLVRNTTSPDEMATGVKSFVVNLPAYEILKLGTEQNLREYIPEYSARKRTRVHEAIRDTIDQLPQRFITRNSGFVISAAEIEVDDAKKHVFLTSASILNGAQSQGEIRQWIADTYGDDQSDLFADVPFYVRAEIIVDSDLQQVVETAIARNTATPVKSISQAGARGHLEDLEMSILARHPHLKIRKSETDTDVLDTRKVLQYARLLMPLSVSKNDSAAEKLRPYKNPEQCLTDFSYWFERKDSDRDVRRKYEFTVQIAPYAIDEYAYWESHSAWNGQHVWEETKKGGRACRRDKRTGRIVWVSPGLIFPIIGAMSEFVREVSENKWVIEKPSLFKESEMITRAVNQFRALDSDPMAMGRAAGAYDAVRIYPATIIEVMRDMKERA